MIIFIKKIKTKEGINAIDLDKIKKGIPEGYKVSGKDPVIDYTANHVVVAYKCEQIAQPQAKAKAKKSKNAKAKKTSAAKA